MLLCSLAALFVGSQAAAQDQMVKRQKSQKIKSADDSRRVYFGIGLGMDYGGMGFQVEFLPIKYVAIFGAGGYNFNGLGLNAGASFKALPNAKITPTVIAMYGYNSVIVVQGASSYNKTYFGPTAGIGGELKVGRKQNKLKAALLYPFRTTEFDHDYEALKANPYIDVSQDVSPVAFSIGFNFAL